MTFFFSSAALFGLILLAATVTAETTKYSYKDNANQAYTSSYWLVDPCVDMNSFSMYATDGFFKSSDSKKTSVKYLNGEAAIYSDCTSTGATLTTFNFYLTEPLSGLVISSLTNVTVKTNVTAFFTKSTCTVESSEYPNSDSPKNRTYYVCGSDYESETNTLTIDTVMKLPTSAASSKVYSSNNKGVNRGPGYLEKYESKSKCKTVVATKNTLKWGKKMTIIIPDTDFSNTGEICKVSSGYSERVTF
jgi:hypothetical protein